MTNSVSLAVLNIEKNIAQKLSHEYASRYSAIPFNQDETHLHVAFGEPWDAYVLRDITDITGMPVLPYKASGHDVKFQIDRLLGEGLVETITSQFLVDERIKESPDLALLQEQVSSAPVVRLVDSILEAGVINCASDIHIEPFGHHLRARLRIDGLLVTKTLVDVSLLPNVISRLKIMGGMDIAEKRFPQDGQFTYKGSAVGALDFRLSTLPTVEGEKAVIRLLYSDSSVLENLGFLHEDLTYLNSMFAASQGAVFLTGPTGSGKSTTLAAYLKKLNIEERNIVTIEDPVEYPQLGVNHVSVSLGSKLGFKDTLKHILRQDPDVILVGEVRDGETAKLAMQASITGHLVLSTIHTNDAAGVVERLIDMGIPPYMVSASLHGVISQRLVRKICANCKTRKELGEMGAKLLGLPQSALIYEGQGCNLCQNTGYKKRTAVYEYFLMTDVMKKQLSSNPEAFVEKVRKNEGLKKSAIRTLLAGETTLSEIIRVMNHSLGL